MDRASESAVVFEAELRPHRSAGPAANRVFMFCIAGALLLPGLVFGLLGAWPVFGFLGLEVMVLYLALRFSHRLSRGYETLTLTADALIVRRVDHWGDETTWRFPPHWLQVNLVERPARSEKLELRSHGKSLVIGGFLYPEERQALAENLRAALKKLPG